MLVDAARIRRRLLRLERCIRTLRELRTRGRAAFASDEALLDRVERNVQVAASLAGAVRLRNIRVHDDLDVDPGRLFDKLGWIEDATSFGTAIEMLLESTDKISP